MNLIEFIGGGILWIIEMFLKAVTYAAFGGLAFTLIGLLFVYVVVKAFIGNIFG